MKSASKAIFNLMDMAENESADVFNAHLREFLDLFMDMPAKGLALAATDLLVLAGYCDAHALVDNQNLDLLDELKLRIRRLYRAGDLTADGITAPECAAPAHANEGVIDCLVQNNAETIDPRIFEAIEDLPVGESRSIIVRDPKTQRITTLRYTHNTDTAWASTDLTPVDNVDDYDPSGEILYNEIFAPIVLKEKQEENAL